MLRPPRVSIIMAAFNAEPFVEEAIRSLQKQTYENFELIAVNDGSKDSTGEIISKMGASDPRIRLITQDNLGLAAARNAGIEFVRGEFIAVADADDVSFPARLECLVQAFDRQPDLAICGGWVESWDGGEGKGVIFRVPATDAGIRAGMPFESTMFDPTVMYRRTVIDPPVKGYDPNFKMAVDYDLWTRLLSRERFANCPRVLTRYRRHGKQITMTENRSGRSLKERQEIWRRLSVQYFGIEPTTEELRANEIAATWQDHIDTGDRDATGAWLHRLWLANQQRRLLPPHEFGQQLAHRWLWVCAHAAHMGLSSWRAFYRSPLSRLPGTALRSRLALAWRCLLRSD